jgi:hypothetical protein
MTNAEMDAIQVQDTPMLLKRALSPGFELLGQGLIEATDRAGDFEQLPSRFEQLPPRMSRTRPSHEHLRQPFGDVRSGSRTGITARQPPKNCTCTFRRIQLKPSQGTLSAPGFVTFSFW